MAAVDQQNVGQALARSVGRRLTPAWPGSRLRGGMVARASRKQGGSRAEAVSDRAGTRVRRCLAVRAAAAHDHEMWALGSTMHPLRLALFLAAMFPVLGGLAYYAGFEQSFGWLDFVLNACVAWAIAFFAAALGPGMSSDEVVGRLALQAVPASIGAMLARSQLGAREESFIVSEGAFWELLARPVARLLLLGITPSVLSQSRLVRARIAALLVGRKAPGTAR